MSPNKAYQTGYDARAAGQELTANPFSPLQSLHTDWANGWLDRRDYEMIPAKRRAYGYGERHPAVRYL
jgi:ribosome modulation factor